MTRLNSEYKSRMSRKEYRHYKRELYKTTKAQEAILETGWQHTSQYNMRNAYLPDVQYQLRIVSKKASSRWHVNNRLHGHPNAAGKFTNRSERVKTIS